MKKTLNLKNNKSKKYENNKSKKQFIKKFISRSLPNNEINKGGSNIYKNGEITQTDYTYNGAPFFRKVFHYSTPPTEDQQKAANAENKIIKILMNNPYPNIVTYFDVNNRYIDMENVNTDNEKNTKDVIEIMKKVKDFLQNLGIMYIDWKMDNIGISDNGEYKLFDFNVSGILDLKTNKWILKPLDYWSYNEAIKNGCTTPKQIDDWSFNYNMLKINTSCNV